MWVRAVRAHFHHKGSGGDDFPLAQRPSLALPARTVLLEKGGSGDSGDRAAEIGVQIDQRDKHEGSRRPSRMRHTQMRQVQVDIAVEEKVDIDLSGMHPRSLTPTQPALDFLEEQKELLRLKRGLEAHDLIEVALLLARTYGEGLEDPALVESASKSHLAQPPPGAAEGQGAIPEV